MYISLVRNENEDLDFAELGKIYQNFLYLVIYKIFKINKKIREHCFWFNYYLFYTILEAQNKGYGTFYEEALRIFTSLQELENVADPIAVTQVRLAILYIIYYFICKILYYSL